MYAAGVRPDADGRGQVGGQAEADVGHPGEQEEPEPRIGHGGANYIRATLLRRHEGRDRQPVGSRRRGPRLPRLLEAARDAAPRQPRLSLFEQPHDWGFHIYSIGVHLMDLGEADRVEFWDYSTERRAHYLSNGILRVTFFNDDDVSAYLEQTGDPDLFINHGPVGRGPPRHARRALLPRPRGVGGVGSARRRRRVLPGRLRGHARRPRAPVRAGGQHGADLPGEHAQAARLRLPRVRLRGQAPRPPPRCRERDRAHGAPPPGRRPFPARPERHARDHQRASTRSTWSSCCAARASPSIRAIAPRTRRRCGSASPPGSRSWSTRTSWEASTWSCPA